MPVKPSGIRRAAAAVALTCGGLAAAPDAAGAQPPALEPPPSVTLIDQRLAEIAQAADLDEATQGVLRDLYQQALVEMESAARWRVAALDFARRTAEASAVRAELDAALAEPVEPAPGGAPEDDLDFLEQQLAEAVRQLDEATARLSGADAEPLRRTGRRAEIRETLADLADRAARLDADLDLPGAPGDAPAVAAARRTLLAVQRMLVENRATALGRELSTYDAERPLLPRRRELAARDVTRLQQQVSALGERVDALRRTDVSQQVNDARLRELQLGILPAAADASRQVLVALARANGELTARRQSVVNRLDAAQQRHEKLRRTLAELTDRFTRTRERIVTIGQTSTVGLLLQRHRGGLPDDRRRYRGEQRVAQEEALRVQEALFDLDEQRLALTDVEAHAAALIGEPDRPAEPAAPVATADAAALAVRNMLETQRSYLDQLFDDQTRYFDALVELGATYGQLEREAAAFLYFIDEHVLWTRSASLTDRADLRAAADAARWLLRPDHWASAARALAADAAAAPAGYAAVLALVVALPRLRRLARTRLAACGERAAASTATRYLPTLQGLLLTLGLAIPGPAIVWGAAWRLARVPDDAAFAPAVAAGLAAVAMTLLPLDLLRQASGPRGLMEAHFLWTARPVALLRRHLGWFMPASLPFVFAVGVMGSRSDPGQAALEGLALIGLQASVALFLYRVLRPASGIFAEMLATRRGGWMDRLRLVWFGAAVGLPLGLAGMALTGYVYAANRLAVTFLETLWLAVGVVLVHGLVSRAVLVSRRMLLFRQRRERALADPAEPAEPAPDLAEIDAQTRHLIRTLVTAGSVAGVWLVWSDMVPALSVLDRVVLWPPGADPEAAEAFTLEHLVLTVVLAGLTAATARNLPASIDLLLLRLPIEPGGRYALTSASRYALIFAGLLAIFGVLGVTWSSVQWLVAAVGVGLGFGLQEIFANFVSGMILLAERPIRVGDTITVGGVTGTVTRIRARATTVQNWDMQELIVPNKDLVTGHLMNWTLSDAANRVTVTVGAAYESDADRVTDVLREIVAAEPLVLDDPAPIVTFEEFGDSALKFVVRAYVSGLDTRLPAVHALHAAIARRFRQEEIEIAFPQMDVRVKQEEVRVRDAPAPELALRRNAG